ncbi:hypothetical protein ACIA74_36635 [Streptomyces sp. NPDC051658]|uniref:hypothetical protein n=1 Tax=Streptomyces sp. NPDC051658 TaxID=3365667 RepID=UPI0037953EBC
MNTLRGTCEDAELHDRMRPRCPSEPVAGIVKPAGLTPRRRVLEVGPCAGQLTVPLAESGGRARVGRALPWFGTVHRDRPHRPTRDVTPGGSAVPGPRAHL